MPRNARNTKDEIVTVAMRMFIENGYDKTSLREIADEIGVTKAALYYHFRTKDDIVVAAMDAHSARMSGVIEWLETAATVPDRNEQLVDKLLEVFTEQSGQVMSFGQANPTAMNSQQFGDRHVGQIRRLMTLLAGENAGPEETTRATLAFGALVIGTVKSVFPMPGTNNERRAAGKKIALELLGPLKG